MTSLTQSRARVQLPSHRTVRQVQHEADKEEPTRPLPVPAGERGTNQRAPSSHRHPYTDNTTNLQSDPQDSGGRTSPNERTLLYFVRIVGAPEMGGGAPSALPLLYSHLISPIYNKTFHRDLQDVSYREEASAPPITTVRHLCQNCTEKSAAGI